MLFVVSAGMKSPTQQKILFFVFKLVYHYQQTENQKNPRSSLGLVKRIWYLSPMRAVKVQASLRIRAVSPNLRCSLIQAVSQEEPSDRKPDPWPLWMAGHAQLKFVMTECSKTQIHLMWLSLIKIYTVCLDLSVWKHRIITVHIVTMHLIDCTDP